MTAAKRALVLCLAASCWACEDQTNGELSVVPGMVLDDASGGGDLDAALDQSPSSEAFDSNVAETGPQSIDVQDGDSVHSTADAAFRPDGSHRMHSEDDSALHSPDAESVDAEDAGQPPEDSGLDEGALQPIERRCNDGLDDDGDGAFDCEDTDCRLAPVCFGVAEICNDGRDNNGDSRVDCDDVTCHLEPGCPPPVVEPFTTDALQDRLDLDCVPCHGPPQPEMQLDLSAPFAPSVVNVLAFQVQMPHVKPGDRDGSWLYQKIRYRQLDFMGDGDGMPPEHTWTAADAERLGLWIEQQ